MARAKPKFEGDWDTIKHAKSEEVRSVWAENIFGLYELRENRKWVELNNLQKETGLKIIKQFIENGATWEYMRIEMLWKLVWILEYNTAN